MTSSSGRAQEAFDAIVIGTGFGGAVASCRLVQAGLRICVLERGRRFEKGDFSALADDQRLVPELSHASWGGDLGLWDLRNLGELEVAQAAGYGGGSLVYANVHLRAQPEVFAGWPGGYSRSELDPYYDLVAYMLEVRSPSQLALAHFPKSRGFRSAAHALGRTEDVFETPIATQAARHAGANVHGHAQGACDGCGACDMGCRRGAKNTLDYNYLAIMEAARDPHGNALADVRTLCEVSRIEAPRGEAALYTVRYTDHLKQQSAWVRAPRVLVCAGALNTTELLLRSRPTLPKLSPRLGRRVFTNADMLGVVVHADESHAPTYGPTITTGLVHREHDGREILLQEAGFPYAMRACLSLFQGRFLLARNRHRDVPDRAMPSQSSAGLPEPANVSAALAQAATLLDELLGPRYAALLPAQLRDLFDHTARELDALVTGELARVVARTEEELLEAQVARLLGRLPAFARDDARLQAALARTARGTLRMIATAARRSLGASDAQLVAAARNAVEAQLGLRDLHGLLTRLSAFALSLDAEPSCERARVERTAVLVAMAKDPAPSSLELSADGVLLASVPASLRETCQLAERLMRDFARSYGGELRLTPGWAFARRPASAHLHGGCAMADSPLHGVTDAYGRVHGHPGLYVLDGAAIPAPLGVNPSSTIAAVAERNIQCHLREWLSQSDWRAPEWRAATRYGVRHREELEPLGGARQVATTPIVAEPIGLTFRERMTGFLCDEHAPLTRAPVDYERAEALGRARGQAFAFDMHYRIADLEQFLESPEHRLELVGDVELREPGASAPQRYAARGSVAFFQPSAHATGRALVYEIAFDTEAGACRLVGRKALGDTRRLAGFPDTTTVLFELDGPRARRRVGIVRVSMADYLSLLLPSMRVTGTTDPARIAWASARFLAFFVQGLWRARAPGGHAPVTTDAPSLRERELQV